MRYEGWLTGWKAIAQYTGLSIDTCKSYTKRYSLPVKHLPGGKPVALPYELDQYLITFDTDKKIELKNKKRSL
jgi:hypothetical protein